MSDLGGTRTFSENSRFRSGELVYLYHAYLKHIEGYLVGIVDVWRQNDFVRVGNQSKEVKAKHPAPSE